jgi:hypothetical protein
MFNNLSMLARAREQALKREADARRENRVRRKKRRSRLSRIAGQAMYRLGSSLVSIGRRLECYEIKLVRKSDFAAG